MSLDTTHEPDRIASRPRGSISRRDMLLTGVSSLAAASMVSGTPITAAQAQQLAPAAPTGRHPNIVVIFGDDIGQSNLSAYTRGLMGYQTPNIDRLANEGVMFTDYYG